MTPARLAGIATVIGLVTACGSTVVPGVSGGSAATGSDGLSVQQPGTGGAAAMPAGGSASGSLGPASVGTTGSALAQPQFGGARTAASTVTADGAAPSGVDGPGVTASTITIGISYYQSAKAANAALGANGVDTGDPVASTRMLIDWINKTGGVAGRRLVPLFFGVDPQSSTPYANEAQAECSYFTEDHKVLAVIDGTPALDARPCFAQHGVADFRGPMVTAALTSNEVDAYTARLDRAFTALVPALGRSGWFDGWNRVTGQPGPTRAKTGIVTPDSTDDNRAVADVLIPALRAAGYAPAPADVIHIARPGGFSDDGATVAAIDNAVLKLNADGVDHVIVVDDNGSLSLLFNNYAASQAYFPRYGGTSGNGWQVLLTAGDIQAKTLRGAIGIGWQPLMDVPYGRRDGDGAYPNAARRRCFDVFRRGGMPHTDAVSAGGQAEGCDVTFLLRTIFNNYRGPVNLPVLLDRVDTLGSSYPLASGFASHFSSDQHDGAGAFATIRFTDSCNCMQYVGQPQPMPR